MLRCVTNQFNEDADTCLPNVLTAKVIYIYIMHLFSKSIFCLLFLIIILNARAVVSSVLKRHAKGSEEKDRSQEQIAFFWM